MSGKGKKEDTPNSEKSTRLSKGRRNSFRFGKKSTSLSRASGISGKTVQVKGHSSVEELKKKKDEVFRWLKCSEDAINKNIHFYLVGIPSMVLENVISLTREVDQMSPNANSSELASLMSHMNETVAKHAMWIDHFYLYGDGSHSDQPIQTVTENVRQAVTSLVEFAIHKENQNVSDSNFFQTPENDHNESNGSLCSQDSPCPRKKLNETRNSHTHGSMPEIPSAISGYGTTGHGLSRNTPPPPSKLKHSFSSDSILDNKENVNSTSTNSPGYVVDDEVTSSCDEETAPPIPPKKNVKGRSPLRSSSNDSEATLRQSSPFNSSFDDAGEFASRKSAGSVTSSSTPHSSFHSLNCSSSHSSGSIHDSAHQTFPYFNHSVEDFSLRVADFTSRLPQDCESTSSGYCSNSTVNSARTPLGQTFNAFISTADSLSVTSSHVTNTSTSQQQLVIHRSSRNSACSSSSRSSGSEVDSNPLTTNVPPIPKKVRQQLITYSNERAQSQYDNIDGISSTDKVDFKHHSDFTVKSELIKTREMNSLSYNKSNSGPASSSLTHRRYNETYMNQTSSSKSNSEKPPLPLKQKHVMAYMETFKDYQLPEKEWFQHRRSQQMISSYQTPSVSLSEEFKELGLESHVPNSRLSLPNSANKHTPPALPPKRKSRSPDAHRIAPSERSQKESLSSDRSEGWQPSELCSCRIRDIPVPTPNSLHLPETYGNVVTRTKKSEETEMTKKKTVDNEEKMGSQEALLEFVEETEIDSVLDSLNVNELIVFQGETEESDVKAASVDVLVVYATYSKNGTYLEAFLTTYRTFLTPEKLISKLFYRYYKFVCRSSTEYQKAAKNAFSLLVRVVHDLVVTELTDKLCEELAQFDYNLLSKGDLKLAFYFRKKFEEKLKLRKNHQEQSELSCHYLIKIHQNQYTFLAFKSTDIADQMTLLDSEFFSKFGIPELLHYSREQNEEHCPNLTAFAMKINRMSSWVKTQILKSNTQDREKYYKKFIKIMKHLRRVNNNFNSCLTILCGLESPDVRRLDWPKASGDMLKEYSDLFDFEGSYRAYRQALAETKPPCTPHLGIILQDLTKLDLINPNFVDGKVNFLKRWLQFNILEDMKRFIPSKYDIKKDDDIRNFINNYEDYMSDSDLWDLSLSIKPRAKPK